jgi:RNA polymerase sigma-70 factor (ECF subfamily)
MVDIPREVIELAKAGDLEAFQEIYKAATGFVYNVALRITNNRQEAEEVTQDVFLKVYRNLKDFEFRASLKTWIYRITANTALNAYKRISKVRNRTQGLESIENTVVFSGQADKDIIKHDEQKANEEALSLLLGRLNADQRSCIVLREIEGLRYEEIARALKININTVRSRLKRAREAMAAFSQGGLEK